MRSSALADFDPSLVAAHDEAYTHILRALSFEARVGEVTVVLGRNGVLVDLHGVPGQLVVCLREGLAEHLI